MSSSWVDGFVSSFSMILVSEIGDKTFFIACLMAMRHPKLIVFTGAIGALAAMTVLSALMGVIVPSVLSVQVTQILAVVLFFVFGVKILYDTLTSSEEDPEEERAEAAAALRRRDENDALEAGSGVSTVNAYNPSAKRWRRLLTPVLVEAFTLTFIAEWGDRSQLATVALAAAKNAYAVTLGGILGHAICTGGAVVSGNLIANHVSMRTVNLVGGVLFIFFALVTLYELLKGGHMSEMPRSTKMA